LCGGEEGQGTIAAHGNGDVNVDLHAMANATLDAGTHHLPAPPPGMCLSPGEHSDDGEEQQRDDAAAGGAGVDIALVDLGEGIKCLERVWRRVLVVQNHGLFLRLSEWLCCAGTLFDGPPLWLGGGLASNCDRDCAFGWSPW
jgi:hypothetical protein